MGGAYVPTVFVGMYAPLAAVILSDAKDLQFLTGAN